jgi:hypothetical protein
MEEACMWPKIHMAKSFVGSSQIFNDDSPSMCYLIYFLDQLGDIQPNFRHEVMAIFTFFENSKNYFKPNPL